MPDECVEPMRICLTPVSLSLYLSSIESYCWGLLLCPTSVSFDNH